MDNVIDLKQALMVASGELKGDLRNLDINSLAVSDYNKNYLRKHLKTLDYVFEIYVFTIIRCLEKTNRHYTDITLVDYGAGTGLLGLLAKKAGIGTVIYNDIYDVSCEDARVIASALNIIPDHFVVGDIGDLVLKCRETKISPDALVSMDVLEHIYNLDDFMKSASGLSPDLVMVHTTGANIENPRTRKELTEIQRKNELEGFNYTPGHKERDSLKPYLEIRENLIREKYPALTPAETELLAKLTRGRIREDIFRETERYISEGTLPAEMAHPTNTCDPLTGNWAERLLSFEEYKGFSAPHSFKLERFCGFYNRHTSNPLKKIIIATLNMLLRTGGEKMAAIAPFISFKFTKMSTP